MATNRDLKAALLEKLGITEQALNLRAQRRKKHELPMTTQQAYYTFAYEEGLDLARYLTPEEIADTRALIRDLKAASAPASANGGGRSKPAPRAQAVVKIGDLGLEDLPGMTPAHAREAREMAKVYTALYLFENSLRDVIERILSDAFGSDWWTKAVPPKIQNKASDRKADEGRDPWHGKRGARPIDYVDLSDLARIIKHKWKHFEKLFPSGVAWVEVLVTTDMNVSRRVVAHMNPLDADDIANVKSAYRKYAKALKANQAELP